MKMPFLDRLYAFQLPPGFKLPQLELYDGTGHLVRHLQDELMAMVITHIELAELKAGAEQPIDLSETVLRKERDVLK
ncbi:hypothetical protein LIER_29001 [Lithospermum erythrorhizon]|uniref:Uncharacterized protein n=1 Tax=Lithospermum erythrorhizon TaxID=34254 RepID=A0AAV3RHP0_LITER